MSDSFVATVCKDKHTDIYIHTHLHAHTHKYITHTHTHTHRGVDFLFMKIANYVYIICFPFTELNCKYTLRNNKLRLLQCYGFSVVFNKHSSLI